MLCEGEKSTIVQLLSHSSEIYSYTALDILV